MNKGYYNVEVNSTFAKLLNQNEFELVYNIKPFEKVFFNNLTLELPNDFENQNYSEIEKLFENIRENLIL